MTDFTCKVDDHFHSACKDLSEYQDTGYCVLHSPAKDKEAEFQEILLGKLERSDFDFGGVFFPADATLELHNRRFDERANFRESTFSGGASFTQSVFREGADFARAQFLDNAEFYSTTFETGAAFFQITFRGSARFSGAIFGDYANFSHTAFDAETDFYDSSFQGWTTFSGAAFRSEARFHSATFQEEADFRETTFQGPALFSQGMPVHGATLFKGEASFAGARFESEASFSGATFEMDADFQNTFFASDEEFSSTVFKEKANFADAIFDRSLIFRAATLDRTKSEPQTDFHNIKIGEAESSLFRTVSLRPSWLVNVTDARKLRFINVSWCGVSLEEELKALEDTDAPHYLLARTCRELAINAEDSHDYMSASKFNYWALDAQRRELSVGAFAPWRLLWWYWLLSGYSERHVRPALWIVAILLGFAGLYMWQGPVGVQEFTPVGLLQSGLESIVYSLGVMTRLTNDIPQSEPVLVRSLIILEGVLGPFQIAIFALALRRRFMR
jgi:uncharacterized protein YjbI with pentapeptide repeats